MNEHQIKEMVKNHVEVCRREIDRELLRLHEQDMKNAWTEERAEEVAKKAAELAMKQMTDKFYMTVGKRTIATIGALVVISFITFKDQVAEWLTRIKL